MKATNGPYSLEDSVARIDEILSTSDASFEDKDSIPDRSALTFTNGYYVSCTCIFMDIRDSSGLTSKYLRPTLARIYRSFISEAVAVINSATNCREVNIHGDAVWGVIDTPYRSDIDDALTTVGRLSSLLDILNCRMRKKKGLDPIQAGIGIDYGRALMIKAGYKGSTINDVVWMGDVVNGAAKLATYGAKTWGDQRIMASSAIHQNLNDDYKKLLNYNYDRSCFQGNFVNTAMNDWLISNCATN